MIAAVSIPFFLASSNPPITYGVLPEAAMPTTTSIAVIVWAIRSTQACLVASSAFSTAFLIAISPPAINPTTNSCGTPNVGGHSEASKIPNRPLVPAPTYTILPPTFRACEVCVITFTILFSSLTVYADKLIKTEEVQRAADVNIERLVKEIKQLKEKKHE